MPESYPKMAVLEVFLLSSSWRNRGTYGRILKKVVQRQVKRFELQDDQDKAISLAHNIGYLTNILNTIIKDEENSQLEKRIDDLEKIIHESKK